MTSPEMTHAGEDPWFMVEVPDDGTGKGEGTLAIPLEAVAVEGELLGYADMGESLAAIIHKLTYETERSADPKTGHNVWTDAFTLLTRREQAREQEAARARQEGTRDDPRSPKLRSALAAYNAVHQPIDGGECAMDRCRRAAREEMQLPEPSGRCGATTRGAVPSIVDTVSETGATFTPESLEFLSKIRSRFLHSLVGPDDDNPIGDTPPPPEPENPILSADELMQKFGGTT